MIEIKVQTLYQSLRMT